jgi:REP element-mobilizing transposase RayT
MFLLKPSRDVNNIIGACLGRALEEHPLMLHSVTTNINHMELIFSIGEGQADNVSRFLREFAGPAARDLNRFYGREGHFWSARARVEEITSDNQAEKLFGYGACNAVKDGLVERARHWKGFSSTEALSRGGKLKFEYVNRTLWWKSGAGRKAVDPSKYTKQTEIILHPLPSWAGLPEHARQTRFRHIVSDREQQAQLERAAEGITSVMGMPKIERLSPFAKPSRPRKRTPQPLCHADTREEYEAYEAEYKEVAQAHRKASAAFLSGNFNAVFPPGTFRPPLVTVATA